MLVPVAGGFYVAPAHILIVIIMNPPDLLARLHQVLPFRREYNTHLKWTKTAKRYVKRMAAYDLGQMDSLSRCSPRADLMAYKMSRVWNRFTAGYVLEQPNFGVDERLMKDFS